MNSNPCIQFLQQFDGVFIGCGVWVTNKEHALLLFTTGNYGKGFLSRSKPLFFDGETGRSKKSGGFHIKSGEKRRGNAGVTTCNAESTRHACNCLPDLRVSTANCCINASDTEHLQLSLEEAFFLVYGLGCLKIVQEDNTELTVAECWKIFCMVDPAFISMYTAYHYYRTNKWIPKSGLKYGVDLVLYGGGGISLQHAQYGVIVKSIDATHAENGRSLSWATFSHVTRLAEHVAKGIVLCCVVHPPALHVDILAPTYLAHLEIIEVVLDRWQPAQTR